MTNPQYATIYTNIHPDAPVEQIDATAQGCTLYFRHHPEHEPYHRLLQALIERGVPASGTSFYKPPTERDRNTHEALYLASVNALNAAIATLLPPLDRQAAEGLEFMKRHYDPHIPAHWCLILQTSAAAEAVLETLDQLGLAKAQDFTKEEGVSQAPRMEIREQQPNWLQRALGRFQGASAALRREA